MKKIYLLLPLICLSTCLLKAADKKSIKAFDYMVGLTGMAKDKDKKALLNMLEASYFKLTPQEQKDNLDLIKDELKRDPQDPSAGGASEKCDISKIVKDIQDLDTAFKAKIKPNMTDDAKANLIVELFTDSNISGYKAIEAAKKKLNAADQKTLKSNLIKAINDRLPDSK